MNWKQYQNELIVLAALLVMLFSFMYKYNQVTSREAGVKIVQKNTEELKEAIALKKIWGDKKTGKKVESLQVLVPENKLKWSKKGKKLIAVFMGINANELNKLTTKILNLPMVITLLDVKKIGTNYKLELKCNW